MFLAFVLLLALRCFYTGQRCFKVPLIVPWVACPNADEMQADWVRGSVWAPGDFEYGISANLRMASYRVRSQMNMDLVRIV